MNLGAGAANPSRRRFLAGLVASPLVLQACGPNSSGADDVTEAGSTTASAFPVTVKHKYGETTVEKEPRAITCVGLTEQDALLALGTAPVGTTEWFGEKPGAIWPWAKEAFEKTEAELPTVVGDATKVNFERIASTKPDLILALYSGITKADYDRLKTIAPTVAQPKKYVDYGIPWEELTRTVGRVVGKADEADKIIKDVEQAFADARAEHPEFDGASAVVATPYEGIFVYGPQDPRGRFLTALGFELPPNLAEITGAEFGGNLSEENVDLLDLDVVVWLDAKEVKDYGGPLYQSLAVHKEGREVHLSSYNETLGAATSFVSALSLPYLIEGIVPKLAAALDGDPNTTAE